jgi:hypothetical protein
VAFLKQVQDLQLEALAVKEALPRVVLAAREAPRAVLPDLVAQVGGAFRSCSWSLLGAGRGGPGGGAPAFGGAGGTL